MLNLKTTAVLIAAASLLTGRVSAAPAASHAAAPVSAGQSVVTTLQTMLVDYRRYAEKLWHTDSAHPGVALGYWGSGKGNGGNEGVRAIATTALAYAVLAHSGDTAFVTTDRVGPALRYAADIHTTGPYVGTDNQKWGNSWQSAMWAANLGTTAWLVRDTLDADTMTAVKRVVAYEADRFIGVAPPTMLPGDTKAEENAWDLTAPAAALLLMPTNPHAAAWHTAVLRYGFNTISTASDQNSVVAADGKTVGDWVTTQQVFPDFTLENHGIFHPVYSMIGPETNAQAAIDYRFGGQPVPDALTYNVLQQWKMLQYITLPDGEWLYPQGLDWDLHDYEHLPYWTMLATLYGDPAASLLESRTVGYARRRQIINGDGSFVGPTGSLGYARESVQAERVSFALLMHQMFASAPPPVPSSWATMNKTLAPAKSFPYVGMVIHRMPAGTVSFSWKNRLMGQVAPQSQSNLWQPYITTPNAETLVGGFSLQGQSASAAASFTVNKQSVQTSATGFVASVDANINSGKLRDEIGVVSLAPNAVVYLDWVTALQPVTVTEERGLLLGIENDNVSGNHRLLSSAQGAATIPAGQNQDTTVSGSWANIDGRLGLISGLGAPILYRAVGAPNRAGAREDYLMGAYHGGSRSFAIGDTVSIRAGIVLLDATAAATAKSASLMTAQSTADKIMIVFATSDGHRHTVSLTKAGITTVN